MALVSSAARVHILERDATGGGHRFGAARGKSQFPASWSDAQIIARVESVANDPASRRIVQPNGRIRCEGDGVTIRVIVDPDGRAIRTAHPVGNKSGP
jgi:filamentous hemagglutinin